jgi:hypothetical protein
MDTFVSNVCIYATNIVRVFLCESHKYRWVERDERIKHTFLDELSQSQRVLDFIKICEVPVFWQTVRCVRKGIKIIYSRRDSVTWNESCTYCENLKLSIQSAAVSRENRLTKDQGNLFRVYGAPCKAPRHADGLFGEPCAGGEGSRCVAS